MECKVCVNCNTDKSFENSHNKSRECKQSNFKRSVKQDYNNEYILPNQREICYDKKKDVLLKKSKLNQGNRKFEKKSRNNKQKNSIKG